jgi:Zn-dependent oligopeptidase
MKKNWIVTLAACMVFSLSLSGCGTATDTASSTASSESSSEAETSGKSEQDLMDEENNILEKNKDLWEKVFASMDKNVTSDTLSSNYGDVLITAVENAKDQFSDAEYEMLKADAEQIRKIEDEIAALPTDSSDESTNAAAGSSFPQFEGNDLDGNKVDSSIFAENAVTVVNFWFNGCKDFFPKVFVLF